MLLNRGEDVASFISDRLAVEPEGAWVEAFGTIENVAIEVIRDGVRATLECPGVWDLLRLTASLGHDERGTAVLSNGGEVIGGLLSRGAARSVCVRVSASGAVAASPAAGSSREPAPTTENHAELQPRALEEPRISQDVVALRAPEPSPSDPGRPDAKSTYAGGATLPPKITRKGDWIEEIYPEEGDRVNHFAFGECTVVGSDGERIRLQQDRDSRVREVALSMLRIDAPTVSADGKKHWNLARKN